MCEDIRMRYHSYIRREGTRNIMKWHTSEIGFRIPSKASKWNGCNKWVRKPDVLSNVNTNLWIEWNYWMIGREIWNHGADNGKSFSEYQWYYSFNKAKCSRITGDTRVKKKSFQRPMGLDKKWNFAKKKLL